MAILQALLSLLSRSASTVLNTIFGWAVRALFGQPSPREQTFLSAVVGAAAAWPVLLVGVAFPKLAALLIAFVPFHNRLSTSVVRIVWIALATLVPLAVGFAVAAKAPPGHARGSVWKRAAMGFPITVALAASFLIMFVSVPLLRVASIVRGRRDEQVPLITTAYDYHEVAHTLVTALNAHGFSLERRQPSWWVAAPTKILRALGGSAFGAYVPDRLEYYREPGKTGLEAALYPSTLLLRGQPFAAVRAHGLALETATATPALQTADAQAQLLEKRIHSLWELFERDPDAQRDTPTLRQAVRVLGRALNELQAPFDDWQILYRQLLQLHLLVSGEPQLLAKVEEARDPLQSALHEASA